MLIKIAIVIVLLLVACIGLLFAVNKTANKMSDENSKLPKEEQSSEEALDEALLGRFAHDVSTTRPVQVVTLIVKDILGMMEKAYNYRVEAAIVVIAVAGAGLYVVPKATIATAYTILGYEVLHKGLSHGYSVYAGVA